NGRQLAAWLGLTPSQYSSGGKSKLGRITKAGDSYLRRHCCKVSDEAAFCLIQRPYISKTLLTRRISPRGSP
ncbi:transposase, partial [Enterobacter hormaechei]